MASEVSKASGASSNSKARTWRVVFPKGVNVRNLPGREGSVTGILQYGERVTEIEVRGTWLHHNKGWSIIQAGDKIALVCEDQLLQQPAPPAAVAAAAAPPAPASFAPPSGPGSLWRVVYPKGVNVRAGPDAISPVIGGLNPGAIVSELERKGDWVRHDKGGWSIVHTGETTVMELVALAPTAAAPPSTPVAVVLRCCDAILRACDGMLGASGLEAFSSCSLPCPCDVSCPCRGCCSIGHLCAYCVESGV